MLSNQWFSVKNLATKSQIRFPSGVRCLSKEQQQTFNKVWGFRDNVEAIRCITTTIRCKPVEFIRKGDFLLRNIYLGSCFSSDKSIHISPVSYQRSNLDRERRSNYIFFGCIALAVIFFIIVSLSIKKHEDDVIVK